MITKGITKIFTVLVILLFSILSLFSNPTQAQSGERGLIVSPIVNDIDADKGQAYEYDLNLENDTSNYNYNLELSLQSFAPSQNDGVPELVDFNPKNDYSKWLSFDKNKINLDKKQKGNIKVKISIPNDAKAGGYYFAIIMTDTGNNSAKNDITGVRISQRIVALLFVNVSGQVERMVKIENLESNQYLYDPFFDGILVKYKIRVDGGSYTKPNGNVFLDNGNQPGKTIFPLNPEEKIVIPQSSRSMQLSSPAAFDIPLLSSTVVNAQENIQKKSTQTSFPDWQKPLFGQQNIEARVIFVNSEGKISQESSVVKVFYAPWKMALLVFIPLILLSLTYWFYISRKKHANI